MSCTTTTELVRAIDVATTVDCCCDADYFHANTGSQIVVLYPKKGYSTLCGDFGYRVNNR